ncbi:MAG: hypothetical protein HYT70_03150 [Candidatus Aenigmarchaeota archaeon]|nr:hypothetical protein [Candidatus Aenigmarchaeota archaeon]
MNDIILLQSLQEKLKDVKYSSHLKIVSRLIKKIEEMGRDALKILDVEGHYLLCEMKVMKPPYRLYVILDQQNNKYYVADWEHKDKQEKAIEELRFKLSIAVRAGLEKIFT